MEEEKALLENYFIYKNDNPHLYYSIRDRQKEITELFNKAGFSLIIRENFAKLEKFSTRPDSFMGIPEFQSKEEYCFLMLLLMFLENKDRDEQFLLENILNFMTEQNLFPIDTTKTKTRRQIVTVLQFAEKSFLIQSGYGDIDDYKTDVTAQVLYDNTGLSKYFVRSFPRDISNCENADDLLDISQIIETDKTKLRRNRVYANLLLRPAVFSEETAEFEYIKNFKHNIISDFAKQLGWSLHVHNEAAITVPHENDKLKNKFPSTDGLSAVVLLLNGYMLGKISSKTLVPDKMGNIPLSYETFLSFVEDIKKEKGAGFTIELRKKPVGDLATEVLEYMRIFSFCNFNGDQILIRPIIGKIIGDYPKDYKGDAKNEN